MDPSHVVMFPLPLQGPVNTMLKLAELLCLAKFHITFVITDHIHTLLERHSNIHTRFRSYPGFRIETVSDGLPENHPRGDKIVDLLDSLRCNTKPQLKDLATRRRVGCILTDGILGFAGDVAGEIGIPVFYLRTISACCLWVFFCLPKLIESGEIPVYGDLDTLIKSVPGMENFLRRRDLPSFCRSGDLNDLYIQTYKTECQENPRAYGLILNTFEELEGPILSEMHSLCPNIYTIGPLHAHLKVRLTMQGSFETMFSNSLWEEDRTCLTWLDSQPQKSVIYVSFGSLVVMSADQYMEFWHGLVNSGQRFLWVIRPDSVTGKDVNDRAPVELSEGTKEKGYIIDWAPQEEVLAHPSVGGFLTHSGWNSTLESIFEGIPMICWPYFIDQQVNSRFVDRVWNLGLDMKDTCDRNIIAKMVRDIMDIRREEFLQRADQMSKSSQQSLFKGGSSFNSLERLIKDIEMLSM